MESKNIKVIDEHGIDRDANIICSLTLDNTDYVLYWIERDEDNDNLFVSKIVKNNDGTSSMVNIEDNIEKSKINDVVKELITYAINNEADKVADKVTLNSGEEVKIANVLFNKEQNINVSKTYVTTVKKNVTKVGSDFYHVVSTSDIATDNKEEVFPTVQSVETPVLPLETAAEEPVLTTPSVSIPTVNTEPVETQTTADLKNESSLLVDASPVVGDESTPAPSVNTDSVEVKPLVVNPLDVEPAVLPNVEEVKPVQMPEAFPTVTDAVNNTNEEIKNDSKLNFVFGETAPQEVKEEIIKPVIPNTSVTPVTPVSVNENPVVEVSNSVPSTPEPIPVPEASVIPTNDNMLVFDASKETNLTSALDGASNVNEVKTPDAQPFREFGQSNSNTVPNVENNVMSTNNVVTAPPVDNTNADVKVLTKSRGFANNKFFMVVAIFVFICACVFLGYEAFRYFQLTK